MNLRLIGDGQNLLTGELLPPCVVLGAPPLPEEVVDRLVAVRPLSLSHFFPYPSATLHRHRMLTIAPWFAQDRRQDLAVDL